MGGFLVDGRCSGTLRALGCDVKGLVGLPGADSVIVPCSSSFLEALVE